MSACLPCRVRCKSWFGAFSKVLHVSLTLMRCAGNISGCNCMSACLQIKVLLPLSAALLTCYWHAVRRSAICALATLTSCCPRVGVSRVQTLDPFRSTDTCPYQGLLCSVHYERFHKRQRCNLHVEEVLTVERWPLSAAAAQEHLAVVTHSGNWHSAQVAYANEPLAAGGRVLLQWCPCCGCLPSWSSPACPRRCPLRWKTSTGVPQLWPLCWCQWLSYGWSFCATT